MLIGIDASRAASAQRTGTENYSLYLIRALLEAGSAHRYRLYFNQAPPEGLFRRDERVTWRILPFPRLWTHLRLSWETLRHPPDVLFVPAHVLPMLHPRRCVATVHDLGYLHYPQAHRAWARWYLDWATRYNARVAQGVVVDSEATRRDLANHYRTPGHKMVVAYPAGVEGLAPVTERCVLAEVRERYGLGQRYLLYVGTIQPRKNLATLIRAYASARRDGLLAAEIRLVLAGKIGWLSDEIVALACQLGLADRVLFPGYIPAQDLPALLSGALAFVLPSWYEGFGLPVLEAMACDSPVICSNVASLPEVAGDAALLVDPHDVQGFARALGQVCGDAALRAELVRRGRERLHAFSWKRCAGQVLGLLESVAADESGRHESSVVRL